MESTYMRTCPSSSLRRVSGVKSHKETAPQPDDGVLIVFQFVKIVRPGSYTSTHRAPSVVRKVSFDHCGG